MRLMSRRESYSWKDCSTGQKRTQFVNHEIYAHSSLCPFPSPSLSPLPCSPFCPFSPSSPPPPSPPLLVFLPPLLLPFSYPFIPSLPLPSFFLYLLHLSTLPPLLFSLHPLPHRTKEQVQEEEMLLAELKKIEMRKKERERKQHDLQKLISAAEQNAER